MSQPVDFLDLFVRSPGELLYFFTIIAVMLASFFMMLGQRLRRPEDVEIRRYTAALLGAIMFWAVVMAGVLIVQATDREPVQILPPLERFATVATIVLMIWAISTPGEGGPNRYGNSLLWLGLALITGGYIVSAALWWDEATTADFNLSNIGATWTFIAAVLSVLGMGTILANFRWVADAPLKIVFFAILMLGYFFTLIQVVEGNIIGDYAGPPRLAFAAAIVIIPALVYRAIVLRLEADAAEVNAELLRRAAEPPAVKPAEAPLAPQQPMERESAQLLRALGIMLEDATSATIPQRVVTAVLEVLKVDVVALLRQNDANYADVIYAYDNPMGRALDGISINLENQPTLVNSIERMAGRPLLVDRNQEELSDLYTRLDIDQFGPAYFQPVIRDKQILGILLVANPYADHELTGVEEDLLRGVSVIAAGLLQLAYAVSDAEMLAQERAIQAIVHTSSGLEAVEDEGLALARQQITELNQQVTQLKIELDDERSRVISGMGDSQEALSVSQQMKALNGELEELRQERDVLAERLQEANAALQSSFSGNESVLFDQIVDSLQHEQRKLRDEKERLEAELRELRRGAAGGPGEMQSVLERMSEEKSRLELEREQAGVQLDEIRSQLRDLGIDDSSGGLAHFIGQLNEQRLRTQRENIRLSADRDQLLQERARFQERMAQEAERDERIQILEQQVQNLAGDREAAFKQQEKLRAERAEAIERLDTIKQHRARLLAQNTGYELELREIKQEQRKLREKIEALSNERSELLQQRDRLIAEKQAAETERDQLMARMGGDRERLQELGSSGVGSLTGMIDELTQQRSQLERELNQARNKLSSVEEELESLRRRASVINGADGARYQPDNPALLLGLVQELRTPMTSIIGYVDLLLGESAGILGEMQRKFMQRVSTNVKRLSTMVDDLVHVTELDAGTYPFEPARIDLVSLIEDVITNASIQFREKGLVINLNIEDNLPPVHGDRDAITQIFGQLLTNAYLVSPPNTEVSVTARRQEFALREGEEPVGTLYVSVEDRGGGIDPEDELRVFARKYKAENPLIQGLGDTGVGLSIAKALTEAHGGRLWLESTQSVGSTFSFALPIDPIAEIKG